MQNINVRLANELSILSLFLSEASEEFESVAKQVREKDIRTSVRSLIAETKQYVEELNSQVKSLSAKSISDKIDKRKQIKSNLIGNKNVSDRKIVEQCCGTEIFFEKAYRITLNEYFPYMALRQLLIYQLNGIKCAFMRLKLLKSLMPAEDMESTEL